MAEPAIPAVPHTPLVAAGAFGRLPAASVAGAVVAGLRAGGWRAVDVCELHAPGLDTRMRSARAVVIAERRLAEATLQGSAAFEIATRARQTGVPCFAVTAHNRLSAFDARMLDLQLVLEASRAAELRAAGRAVAAVL